MPTKRRSHKRQRGSAAEVAAWEMIFRTGRDYFGDLRRFGTVEMIGLGVVSRADAAEAWARLGAYFMANYQPEPDRQPWAVVQFGFPNCEGAR